MKITKQIGAGFLSILLIMVVALGIFGFVIPAFKVNKLEALSMNDSATAAYTQYLPDTDTIYSYAKDLAAMGARMPGTEAGTAAQTYVKEKFEDFGLEDVSIIPSKTSLYTCDHYSLSVEGQNTDAFYINYSGCNGAFGAFGTTDGGVEAELVYVGSDTSSNVDVEGKIVVADVSFQSMPLIAGKFISKLYYDPDNTFGLTETKDIVYMGDSFTDGYFNYMEKGALGYIGILNDYFDSAEYLSEDYTYLGDMTIPGLWVSKTVGSSIKEKIKHSDTPVTANIQMNGSLKEVDAGAVIGYLKGKSDDTIMVQCHYDSITQGAVEDASGMGCLLAMAKMYAQIPAADLSKTILFIATDTHFSDYDTQDAVIEKLFGDDGNIVANLCIEHIAEEYEISDDGSILATGEIDPRIVFVSGSDTMIQIVNEEFVRHRMDRTLVLPATLLGENLCTDADEFYQEVIAVVSLISSPVYLYSSLDTLDKIARDALVPTCETMADILWRFMETDSALLQAD